jgi:hypothetical protein
VVPEELAEAVKVQDQMAELALVLSILAEAEAEDLALVHQLAVVLEL